MIAKHSMEQSQKGEGVEVVENKPHEVIWLCLFFCHKKILKLSKP